MDSISTLNAIKAVQSGLNTAAPAANQTVMLFNADGTPAGKYPALQLVQDGAKTGSGYGSCSTDATTVAKVATLSDFILIKNVPVSILFTKAVGVANATLNINSTGAKPMYYLGTAIQPGIIRPNTIVTFVYDGTNYNIVGIAGLEQSEDPSDLWVDMGLPSGLKWAKRNIDITQANGFAASEYQYECSFVSWGNTDMHNPTTTSSFGDYTWGTANDTEPYVSSHGAALTGNIAPSFDAARVNLGAPWRMPTTNEFAELFNSAYTKFIDANGDDIDSSVTNKLITMNSVVGIRLKSLVNGNIIFFACSGHGNGTSWYGRGSFGYYWASSLGSSTGGRNLVFYSGGVNPQGSSGRYYGFAVRAVQ